MKQKLCNRIVITLTCGVFLAAVAGCYERVVRAEGLGAQGVAVQKPYRSETALDKALFPDNNSSSSDFSQPSSSSIRTPTAPR